MNMLSPASCRKYKYTQNQDFLSISGALEQLKQKTLFLVADVTNSAYQTHKWLSPQQLGQVLRFPQLLLTDNHLLFSSAIAPKGKSGRVRKIKWVLENMKVIYCSSFYIIGRLPLTYIFVLFIVIFRFMRIKYRT